MRTSCIRLRANSRLAILFEDFLEICDGDMLAALLLAILVYWTDIKLAKKDTNLWIWKSHEDFQEDLMVDKPGMQPPHRTTISKKIDFLAAKDFIEWRKNPKLALDRTRHYLVHLPEVQAAIDRLPPIVSRKSDIRLLENRHSEEQASEAPSEYDANVEKPTYVECRKSDNAMSEKRHCIVEKPTSNTNDYNTEITDSEITEEGTYGANAPTHAHLIRNEYGELIEVPDDLAEKALASQRKVLDLPEPNIPTPAALSSEELHEKVDGAIIGVETVKRITDKHKAISDSHAAIRNDEEETKPRIPAVKLQAVAAGQVTSLPIPERQSTVLEHTPGTPAPLPLAVRATADRHGDATSDQAPRSLLPSEPAQADFPPAGSAASGATTAQASGRRSPVPKRPATSAPILTTEEQAVIDRWFVAMNKRYPLTDGLIKAAKLLAPCNPSVEDLKAVRGFCFTSNPEWFRDKRKGAVTLLDIAKNWEAWQSSNDQPQAPPIDEKPTDIYTAASLDKERNQRNIDKLKQKAAQHGHIL